MTLYEKRQGAFYDLWEEASETQRAKIKLGRLQEYIEFARAHIPWYQSRLEGFDLKSSQPLKHVSVLESKDLRELLPPISRQLLTENRPNYNVFQSGGTTGMPKTSLFSPEELSHLDLPNARGFFALGLSPQDRVGNLFAVGGLYMTFLHIHQMLNQYGCTNLPLSNATVPEFIYTVVKYFKVNVLTGISSVLLNALRFISDQKDSTLQIEKIFYGGEHLYEADKEEIKKKTGATLIAAPGYGTVESWYIGYQCKDSPSQVFHVHDDQTWIEIVDEETGVETGPGQIGMIYVTAYLRKLTPIVRYRVGDLAYWLREPCVCGRTTPVFKLLGRGDDVLRIGYDSIDYESIQKLISQIEGLSGTVQMEKKRVEGKDCLVLRVEVESDPKDYASLSQKLLEKLLLDRPSLKSFVEKKTVLMPQVECVQPNTLARNQRTGKLLRVVDKTHEPS